MKNWFVSSGRSDSRWHLGSHLTTGRVVTNKIDLDLRSFYSIKDQDHDLDL